MCGIVGYIGKNKKVKFLLDILKKVEYRGYDSCGIAVFKKENGSIFLRKIKGKVDKLREKLPDFEFSCGIAHTRWATHGLPDQVNAHPQFDCKRDIFLVHNGIIENYSQLKKFLQQKKHCFVSQTDTEVIPHLIEELNKEKSIYETLIEVANKLQGSFAFAFIKKGENAIFAARQGSPFVLGILEKGFVFASDLPAVGFFTSKIIRLEDGEVAFIYENDLKIVNFKGKKVKKSIETVELTHQETDKQGYPHFMLKEIFEQPKVMRDIFKFYVKEDEKIVFDSLKLKKDFLKSLKKVFIFACGTSFHAGYVCKYFLEKYCPIDVCIDVSSEARYRTLNLGENDLVIAISQSGETADTLAVVKKAKQQGAHILGVCNVLGSSLVKESDAGLLYTLAGPEIGVASTKAYTAQLFILYLFSLYLAGLKNTIKEEDKRNILKELKEIPSYQCRVLDNLKEIERIAKRFSKFGCFLFLGRGINYPSSLEGALKLKEISYIPAEGYPAGEMKHGPIALIDEYRAVVCICLQDELYEKMIANLQEIKARKGRILSILNYGDKEAVSLSEEVIYVPSLKNQKLAPLLIAIPLQLFAYFVANNLGCEIDQPRNLAKSVTVE